MSAAAPSARCPTAFATVGTERADERLPLVVFAELGGLIPGIDIQDGCQSEDRCLLIADVVMRGGIDSVRRQLRDVRNASPVPSPSKACLADINRNGAPTGETSSGPSGEMRRVVPGCPA